MGLTAIGAALVGWQTAGSRLIDLWPSGFDFEDIPGAPGFRFLEGGSVSGILRDPFIGLDSGSAAALPIEDVRPNLCANLFGQAAPGVVPIASFSDYNCPYCRVLSDRLDSLDHNPGIQVIWHELPLLGDRSVFGAKLALAARAQDKYTEVHAKLMGSRFALTDTYIRDLANDIGLSSDELIADMNSEAVTAQLSQSMALAEILGIIGTPALVVGRTVVMGEIGPSRMARLIELERAEPSVCR